MDKWDELKATIQELHDNNQDNGDVLAILHYLLNLMKVLEEER